MGWKARIRAAVRVLRSVGLDERVVFPDSVRIRPPEETLRVVSDLIQTAQSGAYLRFGDGDVNLLHGQGELLQLHHPELMLEMEEAFSLTGPGIVKALMLHSPRFGISPEMKPGIHGCSDEWAEALLSRCYKYFIGEPIYSHAALAYLAAFKPDTAVEFLRFLKSQNPIFVGNKDVPSEIVRQLFGDTVHVKTPSRQAYQEIDRIEQETVECIQRSLGSFKVVVVAMGCSGRVLEKRLYKRGLSIFSFDFGSLLDAFCGWKTRAWMELAPYDVRELLERI